MVSLWQESTVFRIVRKETIPIQRELHQYHINIAVPTEDLYHLEFVMSQESDMVRPYLLHAAFLDDVRIGSYACHEMG